MQSAPYNSPMNERTSTNSPASVQPAHCRVPTITRGTSTNQPNRAYSSLNRNEGIPETGEEDAFLAAAPPTLRLAMMLLIYTAQRPSDVLAMTKGHVSEHSGRLWIILRQQKTGELIEVPLHERLAPLVRCRLADDSGCLLLVPSPTGKRWAYRNFARSWDAVRRMAGIEDRQRRDGRRTAVVRLAQAGATVPQIASVTGWGIDYCQRIVDTYLPRRTEVAVGAIDIWERATTADARVVQLGLHRKARLAE